MWRVDWTVCSAAVRMDPRRNLFDGHTIRHVLPADAFYVLHNGNKVADLALLQPQAVYQVVWRVLGGKGGFGSLLRSFKFYKSHNQGMCRDLTGRRIRDVNEEQRLRDWITKKAERERERLVKKQEKLDRMRSGPGKHQFADPDFERQKDMILERTEEALEQGFDAADLLAVFEQAEQARNEQRRDEPDAADETDSASDISDSELADLPGTSSGWILGKAASGRPKPKKAKPDDQRVPDASERKREAAAETAAETETKKARMEQLVADDKAVGAMEETAEQACESVENTNGSTTELPHAADGENEGGNVKEASPPPPPLKKNVKNQKPSNPVDPSKFDPIKVEEAKEPEELKQYDMDHLKAECMRRELKCGGTQAERIARLWVDAHNQIVKL